jgi:hypothetical protein|tara:strand:+ start:253 stop:678 length:426 start_codon:yes stop_codon:yes gene_type:complete
VPAVFGWLLCNNNDKRAMRQKFSIKLNIHPERHREIRLFMLIRFSHMEEGLEKAVTLSLENCKDSKFREYFINLPDPPTGSDKESKEHAYWLNKSFKEPMADMCEIFRQQFDRSTITFGNNAFFYRAICHFMETYKEQENS